MSRAPLLLLACGLAACAPPRLVAPLRYAPPAAVPDEPFRAQPPLLEPVADATDPVRETTLPNGVHLVVIERHDVPFVAAELLVDRGALDLDDAGSFAVAETSYLYGRGGDEAAFERLSADGARKGVTWSTGFSEDTVWGRVRASSASLDDALGILARGSVEAHLSPEEYERRTSERAQRAGWISSPLETCEREVLFDRTHPYGYAGPKRRTFSFHEAEALHTRLFQPTHATVVVVGDVVAEQVDASVAHAFGSWTATSPLPRKTGPAPARNGPRLAVASHRELGQRYSAVFARGPTAVSEDMEAFELAGKVLGGTRSSRLFEHLHEELGAASTVDTTVFVKRAASWMSVAASYRDEKAVEGTRSVLAAMDALRHGTVTDEEIAAAREALLAYWRASMATVEGEAARYASWIAQGWDPARIREYPSRISRLRREDLVRVANTYLDPKALHVVFVGEDRWLDTARLEMGGATSLELGK